MGAALAQFAAQVGEVGVAGDDAESLGASVEHGFEGIERQGDVGGVFARRVLVLQAGRESQPDQCLLPFVGQGGLVAIAATQHHASKLGRHQQGVFQDIGRNVVAIDQDCNTGVDVTGDGAHASISSMFRCHLCGCLWTSPTLCGELSTP